MFVEPRTRVRPPTPGEVVKQRILPKYNLTQDQLAELLHVSRHTINLFCNNKQNCSPSMALRLAKLTGTTPEFWMRLQLQVDMFEARIKYEDDLKDIISLALPVDVKDIHDVF